MKTHIATLLEKKKSGDVVTIQHDATVYDAIQQMVARRVGSVVVTEDGRLRGVFTERDYLIRIACEGRSPDTTLIGDVVGVNLQVVGPRVSVERCMELMTRHRARHLPVVDDGRLIGLVSIGDCVAHLCDELSEENGYLHTYIAGVPPGDVTKAKHRAFDR